MKTLLAFCFVMLGYGAVKAQAFHVVDTSALLIKNTDQSPAHWYIEVMTDSNVDTTLRWKAHFSNIPAAWEINFDDQDNYYPIVVDGDSADFTLFANLGYPQKLIISAILNNTPGHGIVYFDVYDPDAPSFVQTVSFEFIISAVGLDELLAVAPVTMHDLELTTTDGKIGKLQVYDQQGRCLMNEKGDHFSLENLPSGQAVYLVLQIGDSNWVVDWVKP
jgi:hypothetical protein